MKKINYIVTLGIVALAAVSCNVDSLDNTSTKKGLSFNVVLENEVGTKSGDLELRTESGEIPLVLQKVVDTKSVQINNESSFITVYNGTFEVEGNVGGTTVFHANAVYNSETGLWDLQNSTYEWKPGQIIEIVATASNFNNDDFFDGIYYGGNPSSSNYDYTLPSEPNAKDLLVGYFKGEVGSDGCVSLKFNHPLTSLQFKVGNLPEGNTLRVNSISIEGLDEEAHCIATFGEAATTYQWSNYDGTVTYNKTFSGEPLNPGDPLIDGDATFIVIPRRFPHNTEAKIVVNVTEYNRTYDVYASLADQEWKAGETNVYAISYQGARQAILTNGPDVNLAMKALAGGAGNIKHIVFEVDSDVTSTTEVQAPTHWPIYLNWDNASKTMRISTSDITIHTGSNASSLFQGLTALEDITGLNLLNTRNAVDMSRMFESCYSLQSVDLSNFVTDNVTDMSQMFAYLKTMTTLDVSNFNTDNLRGVGGMFRGINSNNLSSLRSITFGENFTLPKNKSFAYTFAFTNLTGALDFSMFQCSNLQDLEYMFESSPRITSVDLSGLGVNASIFFAPSVFHGTAVTAINFGPNITFSGLRTIDTQGFFSTNSSSIVVTCNEAAEAKLKTFGGYNASKVTFQRPE